MTYERTGTEDAPVWELEFPHRPGLVVRCVRPSLRARVLVRKLAGQVGTDDGDSLLALAEAFARDSLLGWNLLWGGRNVPPTAAGIGGIDEVLIEEILMTWVGLWYPRPGPATQVEDDQPDPEDWSALDALSVNPDPELVEPGLVTAGG